MASKPSRDDVLAYVDATGCTAVEAAAHFGDRLSANQVRAWLSRRRKSVQSPPPVQAQPPERNAGPQRGNAPSSRTSAKDLPPDHRERAVRIVTNARVITDRRLEQLRKRIEEGEEIELDAREAQAMLNLQRTAEVVIATHPGLLELTRADDEGVDGAGASGGDDAAARLRRHLGAGGPPRPG
jgi:hypothetical protein